MNFVQSSSSSSDAQRASIKNKTRKPPVSITQPFYKMLQVPAHTCSRAPRKWLGARGLTLRGELFKELHLYSVVFFFGARASEPRALMHSLRAQHHAAIDREHGPALCEFGSRALCASLVRAMRRARTHHCEAAGAASVVVVFSVFFIQWSAKTAWLVLLCWVYLWAMCMNVFLFNPCLSHLLVVATLGGSHLEKTSNQLLF